MSRVNVKIRKPIIGLAGGIGAGKTAAARILETLGAGIVDSDRLSHEELADPRVVETLRSWWGDSVTDGSGGVDRKAIGRIVFRDPSQLARLEGLLYPRIDLRREAMIAAYADDPNIKAVVLDTPKLFESGLDELCDCVIFVEAPWLVRLCRVRESRGWSAAELRRREKLLNRLDKKKAKTDHVVVNHFGIEELQTQIEHVFSSVLASFS